MYVLPLWPNVMLQMMVVRLVGLEDYAHPLGGFNVVVSTNNCVLWVGGVLVMKFEGACKHRRVV